MKIGHLRLIGVFIAALLIVVAASFYVGEGHFSVRKLDGAQLRSSPIASGKSSTETAVNVGGNDGESAGEVADVTKTSLRGLKTGSGPFAGEAVLLSGDSMSLGKAKILFDRENFPFLLNGFERKYSGDPEAQALKRLYFSDMKRQLSGRSDISGVDFECGTTVCIGALRLKGGVDDPNLVESTLGKTNPVYGLMETSDAVGDVIEKRFSFSVDPKVNSISSN
ncbi:hypothetical protein [Xanthomonas sacchari]|uniref:hypothetical protein n=1 Tax=Xanthomonas sacchari TaxID=56458 RepID=UPI00225E3DAC|nr:hypothetical protein [Xanthomonas sacchari]MCW0436281.1 hypothetical protein [Xanthomonas sacchari]